MKLRSIVATLVVGLLATTAAMTRASVVGVSVSEIAEADAANTSTHDTLPPVYIVAADPNPGDTAIVAVMSYTGPSAPGDTTPTLTLDGNVNTEEHTGSVTTAQITYTFQLDAAQPYTLSDQADGFDSFVTLVGPSGDVSTGSGTLAPGSYTLTATQTPLTEGVALFDLSVAAAPVPEPASLSLLGLAGFGLLKRRRA